MKKSSSYQQFSKWFLNNNQSKSLPEGITTNHPLSDKEKIEKLDDLNSKLSSDLESSEQYIHFLETQLINQLGKEEFEKIWEVYISDTN